MNDPKRWSDDPSLPHEVRDWLAHAPRPHDASAANITQMATRAAAIGSTSPFASALVSKLLGAVIGVVLGGAALMAAYHAGVFDPHRSPVAPHAAAAHAPRPVATVVPDHGDSHPQPSVPVAAVGSVEVRPPAVIDNEIGPTTVPTRAPVATRPHRDVPQTTPPTITIPNEPLPASGSASNALPRPEDPLVVQTAQLTLAEDALRRGDSAGALAILDALVTAYPDGATAAEREYYAVVALRRMGRDDESRARAERLIARFPSSPAAARVRRMLGTSTPHENASPQ